MHLQLATRWHNIALFVTCPSSTCRQHKEEVPDDIFEMLLTFTDFMAFKQMFLEYKSVSELQALGYVILRESRDIL